jgi:hypothetical protein
MTEVLRSKLFYARSAVMIAIPTYFNLNNLPPTDMGILKSVLVGASKVAGYRWLSADGLMTHVILKAILEKGRCASHEYFGR